MASTGVQLSGGFHAMRSFRRVLADAAAASPSAPIMAPMKRPPKPGTCTALHCSALHCTCEGESVQGRLYERLVFKLCCYGLQPSLPCERNEIGCCQAIPGEATKLTERWFRLAAPDEVV